MVKQIKDIPFSTFYIIEFFNAVKQKSKSLADAGVIQMLDAIGAYFSEESNLFKGLEELAQHRGTNDLSIFLFDMTDRFSDFEAQALYGSMPDLVEDFINLFQLMIQDPESVRDLKIVIERFESESSSDIQPAEQTRTKKETSLLSFVEYYEQELLQELDKHLGEEQKVDYLALINILLKFEGEPANFPAIIVELAGAVKQLWDKEQAQQQAEQYIAQLANRVNNLIGQISELEKQNKSLFTKIVTTKKIPPKEEVAPKALTVDELLHDYFLFEIEEHIGRINSGLELLRTQASAKNWQTVIKAFRSLKEISMIHGYTGIEWLSEQLINLFQKAAGRQSVCNETSYGLIQQLFTELRKIEQFAQDKKSKKVIKKLEQYLSELEKNFNEKPDAPQESGVAFTETATILSIFRNVLYQKFKKIRALHNTLAEASVRAEVKSILYGAGQTAQLINPAISEKFLKPLIASYDQVTADDEQQLQQLQDIWEKGLKLLNETANFEDLQAMFAKLQKMPAEEEVFTLENDTQIRRALDAAHRALWQATSSAGPLFFIEGRPEAGERLKNYFALVRTNLLLTGYRGFLPALDYFLELLENPPQTMAGQETISEWQNSWQLILDRMASSGRSGEAADIIEVMREVLTAPLPAHEEAASPEPEEERQESAEQIASARASLKKLYDNLNDRQPFKEIENAMHAIRSSAHILNKPTVVDFAVTLEECAEMFELEDIPVPDELLPGLTEGLVMLEALIKEPNTDVTKITADLESLLSQMMLEEEQPSATAEESEQKTKQKTAEEKPLFAGEEEPDEDLLAIFKEESEKFVADLERSNRQLKENLSSESALNDFSQAAHSLHSSAKMLGFREIAQLTSGLEDIAEAILNDEIENSLQLQDRVEQAIAAIKKLSQGEKLSNTDLARVINLLDISRQKIEPLAKEKGDNAGEYLHQVFIEEAQELVEKLNQDMQELEKMPESDTILVSLLRNLHTLKGSAYMTKYDNIGGLAHKLEDFFEAYKEQNGNIKQEMIHPAFTAIDLIDDMVQAVKTDPQALPPQYTARLAEVDNKLFYFQRFDVDSGPMPTEGEEKTETVTAPVVQTRGRSADNVIKINTDYLDNLVNMATDLVVNRTELTAHFEQLKKLLQNIENEKKQLRQSSTTLEDAVEDISEQQENVPLQAKNPLEEVPELQDVSQSIRVISHNVEELTKQLNRLSRDFEKNIQQISNLSKILHSDILRVRMVPVETLFKRFPKAIRQMAREQGKRVTVTVQGNDTEMDRAMVEALAEPLLHILRNALDHGIELPKTRTALGKKKEGNITLRARQDKSQVVVEVIDDGRGIDVEMVKKTIIKKKIASKKAVEQMTEAEILNYIFYPEFSTRETKGKVSGRGVGLDVVANQIQKLKGNIRIRTEQNAGTTFSIRVPLTLVISQALITELQDKMIAIPMIAVQESLEIKENDILIDDVRKYIQAHGKLLPYIALDEILHFPGPSGQTLTAETALILHDAGVSVALGIGRISGRQEIVIKSLGNQLQNVEYIAGGTILTSGEVALILDYTALIRMVELQFFGNVRSPHSIREVRGRGGKPEMELVMKKQPPLRVKNKIAKKVIKDRKARILIVDDSISLRSFVSGVLEKEGFAPLLASDGPEALNILQKEIVDLMITDLEMPEMHGFDLIAQIRQDKTYDELPIVILTGRSGKAQSDKGMELGANAFIGKPFKESDLLQVVAGFFK